MPDPGFDFTRGGIGAEPLPPIDFSAGFKYLQDQQALALQQSRALLSHQGKMAQIAVDQDTNAIRRLEFNDLAVRRAHDEKMRGMQFADNELDREETRLRRGFDEEKLRITTAQEAGRITNAEAERQLGYAKISLSEHQEEERTKRAGIASEDRQNRLTAQVTRWGQQNEQFDKDLEYKKQKLTETSKTRNETNRLIQEKQAEAKTAREEGNKLKAEQLEHEVNRLQVEVMAINVRQGELDYEIESLKEDKREGERRHNRALDEIDRDYYRADNDWEMQKSRERIAFNGKTGRGRVRLQEVLDLRDAAESVRTNPDGSAPTKEKLEESHPLYLDSFKKYGDARDHVTNIRDTVLPSIPRDAINYLYDNRKELSPQVRALVETHLQKFEVDEAKEYEKTDLPQFKETWGSAIRRADKATSNIPEVDDGKGGTRPTSWSERVGVFFQTLHGELGQSVQEVSSFIKQPGLHWPEAAPLPARTEAGVNATGLAVSAISDEATNLSSAISGPRGLSESLALAEGNLGGDEGVYEKTPEMEQVAKSLLNLAKTPEEKLAAWRGVIGEMGYDNKTEIESRLDILLDHRDDKGNRVISPKDIKDSVMDNPVALSLLLGDTLFQDAYLDENPGEAMTAAQIRRYSTVDVRNHWNSTMAEHYGWKVIPSQTTTEDDVLISKNLSVFDDEDVQEKAAELWYELRTNSDQAAIFAHQMALAFEKRPGSETLIPKEKSPMLMLATTLSGTTAERIDKASSRVRSNFQQWAQGGNRSGLGLEYDKMNFHPVPGKNKFWVEHFPDAMGERIKGLFDPFSTGGQ